MNPNSQFQLAGLLIGVVVVLAIGAGLAAVLMLDSSGGRGNRLPEDFDYDLTKYHNIDPALVGYRQTKEIPLAVQEARAIATGPQDRIYVAADMAIVRCDAGGVTGDRIAMRQRPTCLAVAAGGRIYIGAGDHVEVHRDGASHRWQALGDRAVLTCITPGENEVFVADAGNKVVWRFDTSGKLLGEIGRRDEQRSVPGFVIPSPYFDCLIGSDGLLRIANPGRHQVAIFTTGGRYEWPLNWGRPTLKIDGFCGCCNPVALALLPDGRIVTAEKGIPRVKVYGQLGKFECVVAGPDLLAPTATSTTETRGPLKLKVVDLAADSQGRILVLDPGAKLIRVFEPKTTSQE